VPGKTFALQEVHITDEGGVDLTVGRDGVRLALGKPPYRQKLERAQRVLSEIERRKGQVQVVFLDNDAHPERVVARLK
jgi:cell division protein FtsQ